MKYGGVVMGVTLGTAPDSWGVWATDDDTQISWDRFLDEVAEAGYNPTSDAVSSPAKSPA